MSLPSVLIRKSTGQILNRIAYPRQDMQPVVGLDPDLEILLIYEPYPKPNYDPRYFLLKTTEAVTNDPHPEYSHLNCYTITHETEKRPISEIQSHVKAAQRLADEAVFRSVDQMNSSILMLSILDRQNQGLPITPEEESALEDLRSMRVKIDRNQDNYNLIISEIENGNEPDIDAGWERG